MKYEDDKEYNDDIDLVELFLALWEKKFLIIFITALTSIYGVYYSLSLPNKYTSQVILASASNNSSASNLSQYAGIANLAGISLPSGNGSDDLSVGIEIIKSYNFYENFVKNNNLLIPLVAANGWDEASNKLSYDNELYDSINNKWVSNMKYSIDGMPSYQFAHRIFLTDQFNISKDPKTNFISISFEHYSPFISKNVLELLVKEINNIKRMNDIDLAERSIIFLEKEIQGTQLSEVRSGLNHLIQSQIETIMLANAKPEYLFKIASPPIAPELKSGPNRAFICILSFMFGFILSVSSVLLNHYVFQSYRPEE